MYFRRKIRNRVILIVLIVLGFVMWRGLAATTEKNFNCEYKLIYAVCKPKAGNPALPGLVDIFKAGIKF